MNYKQVVAQGYAARPPGRDDREDLSYTAIKKFITGKKRKRPRNRKKL